MNELRGLDFYLTRERDTRDDDPDPDDDLTDEEPMPTTPTPDELAIEPGVEMPPAPAIGVLTAIAEVQKLLGQTGVAKTRKNVQQNYQFRGIDEVLNVLNGALTKAGLLIIPRMSNRTVVERETKGGGALFSVTLTAVFHLVAVSDGTSIRVETYGEAMDTADKATNKAMSAAYKYMALLTFCVPLVGDDADETTHDVASTPAAPPPPPEKPEGLDNWIGLMKAAAKKGIEPLRGAYKAGSDAQRGYLLVALPELIDDLKIIAADASDPKP